MMSNLLVWDKSVFLWFNHALASPRMDTFAVALSSSFLWWVVVAILLLAAVIRRERRLILLTLLLGLTLGTTDILSGRVIKPWIARPRPCHQFPTEVRLVSGCGSPYGFPSNHSANGMAVVGVLAGMGFTAGALWALLLALLVGASRVYLGVHFPLDVLGGFTFGISLGFVTGRWGRRKSSSG